MNAREANDGLQVAVMQPYFAAYTGYYRLLADADVFVIFDCVQFPRRGWVHRNRLPNTAGEPTWLTLPLKTAAYDAAIAECRFVDDAPQRIIERLRTFPSLTHANETANAFLGLSTMTGSLTDYLERQLRFACDLFGFQCRLLRSSSLKIDPALKAQDRVLEILSRLNARKYVNAPGGRELYSEMAFAERGVALHFLPDYQGASWSLLHRLARESVQDIATDIRSQSLRENPPVTPSGSEFA